MINIISRSANPGKVSGPSKVFSNLAKGLSKIGYPYLVNRDLNATKRLWIHDDVAALRHIHRSEAFKVVGPNLFVMPSEIPPDIRLDGVLYLHPCAWAARVWERAGFDACPIVTWPVGIDTDVFQPSSVPGSKRRIMVYHKQRDSQELDSILDSLHDLKLPYSLVLYGHYSELDYREQLANTSFIIWHGPHESQGIALQEAMACDIPLLVCDVTSLSQARGDYVFDPSFFGISVTSAPYFDETCGVKITDLSRLRTAIEFMQQNLMDFQPRRYVLDHLSLEGQARAFVAVWESWGLTYEGGLSESIKTDALWRVPLGDRLRITHLCSVAMRLAKSGLKGLLQDS